MTKRKLDWGVSKMELTTPNGIILPDHVAIVRDDNNAVLGVMKSGYVPYQNSELIELLDKVADKTGMEVVSEGYFGKGEKVYLQLKSDTMRLGNDKIEGYLTGINSFDGSLSLAFGPSTLTISCMNTFYAAFKTMKYKVRHTKNMHVQIDDILFDIDKARIEEKELFKKINIMAEAPLQKTDKEWATKLLFNIAKDVDLNDKESISTVTQNRIDKFNSDLISEMAEKGANRWGLFSGVTKYTTHSMNHGNANRNMESKMVGIHGERERAIFNHLSHGLV